MALRPTAVRRIGLAEEPVHRQITIGACLELVLSQLGGLMDNVLDGLRLSAGLHPTKRAQAGMLRGDLVPFVQQLLDHREALQAAFVGQMRVLCYGGSVEGGTRPLLRFEDIQLLDRHQLDESIELVRVQHELEVAVDSSLARLNALMSSLMGWISIQPTINPLRPELFAKALRDTLHAYVPNAEQRSELLGAAASRMGPALRQVYRELSEWLASSGVEPAGLLSASASSTENTQEQARNTEAARTLLTLDRLRRLFAGGLDDLDQIASRAGVDFLHTVPASVQAVEDMRQVEAMIHRLEQRRKQQAELSGLAAAQRVDLMQQRPMDGREIGREVGEEVTRMMLENLIRDDRLLPRMRLALDHVSTALLRMARIDARFFSDPKHPARQFLERVTDRSLAYANERDEGYVRFMDEIDHAVSVAVKATDDELVVSFLRELERLVAVWEKEDRNQLQMRQEAARALLHVEQRNLLAQRLVHEWGELLKGEAVPPRVVSFLLGPWAQVVAEAQLKATGGGSDTEGYGALVEDLIWSVQPRKARGNPVRLVQMIPRLLSTLRAGLASIAYPSAQVSTLFDELIAWHELALQERRGPRDRETVRAQREMRKAEREARESAFDSVPPDEAPLSEAPWLATGETADAGYIEAEAVIPAARDGVGAPMAPGDEAESVATAGLGEGAWVELLLEGKWTRLQLTWSSPHRTLFMFTSTRGRAHSMSRRTMNRLLNSGVIRIVSKGQMLDQALDSVAQLALLNSIGKFPEPT